MHDAMPRLRRQLPPPRPHHGDHRRAGRAGFDGRRPQSGHRGSRCGDGRCGRDRPRHDSGRRSGRRGTRLAPARRRCRGTNGAGSTRRPRHGCSSHARSTGTVAAGPERPRPLTPSGRACHPSTRCRRTGRDGVPPSPRGHAPSRPGCRGRWDGRPWTRPDHGRLDIRGLRRSRIGRHALLRPMPPVLAGRSHRRRDGRDASAPCRRPNHRDGARWQQAPAHVRPTRLSGDGRSAAPPHHPGRGWFARRHRVPEPVRHPEGVGNPHHSSRNGWADRTT